ncbi:hypothetical protein IRT45_35270 [Nocardia sp. BSTN01]|uniref:hypothetical protein n=1 Tax=Nocardia sp. BSTN01 TaxID=2783665 RepID=UPI00188F2CB1|nr:hypothetical protein [Nocardia sp. BSTN01]MBF5002380.1 hypothetical protein [Nocardia sp. BSTN01]
MAGEPIEIIAHRAMRTVAAQATGAGDCRDLLEMLGLVEAEPLCRKCRLPMSRPAPAGYQAGKGGNGLCWACATPADRGTPTCPCGRPITAVDGIHCGRCYGTVPADDVRALVRRIAAALEVQLCTRVGTPRVAAIAGVNPDSLDAVTVSTSTVERVSEDVHRALVELDERLAHEEAVPIIGGNRPAAEVRANIRLLTDAGLTVVEVAERTGVQRATLRRILDERPGHRQRWVQAGVADKIAAALQPAGVA